MIEELESGRASPDALRQEARARAPAAPRTRLRPNNIGKYNHPKDSIEHAQMVLREAFEGYTAKIQTGQWIAPDRSGIYEYIRQIDERMNKWKDAMHTIPEWAKREAKKRDDDARVD